MGEAKQNQTTVQRFLVDHPICCYCGGKTLATTIDHIPSRQLFWQKHRPKGLEVPACASCNAKTRNIEQGIALMSRIYPSPANEQQREELSKISKAVRNNIPGLVEELLDLDKTKLALAMKGRRMPVDGNPLNASGPILTDIINTFGLKLGLALHYLHTSKVVPPEGGVAVRWYSNADMFDERIPLEAMREVLGPAQTLKQGKWEVSQQFAYASATVEDGAAGAYYVWFRQSFSILCAVALDRSALPEIDSMDFMPPFTPPEDVASLLDSLRDQEKAAAQALPPPP